MLEQTRIRLGIIAARFAPRAAARDESEREWLAAWDALRSGTLRTAMTEIGDVLAKDGHRYEIRTDIEPETRSIDFAVTPRGEGRSERRVRLFVREDERRGWQVIAEIWLSQSPAELTRFERSGEVTAEVAEQLLVDAVEQIFASVAASDARQARTRMGGE